MYTFGGTGIKWHTQACMRKDFTSQHHHTFITSKKNKSVLMGIARGIYCPLNKFHVLDVTIYVKQVFHYV